MIEPIARIRIELQEIEPTVWRRIDVPLSSTLLALHDFIQFAFRWTDSHLFEFEIGERRYGQPEYDRYADERLYKAASIRLAENPTSIGSRVPHRHRPRLGGRVQKEGERVQKEGERVQKEGERVRRRHGRPGGEGCRRRLDGRGRGERGLAGRPRPGLSAPLRGRPAHRQQRDGATPLREPQAPGLGRHPRAVDRGALHRR